MKFHELTIEQGSPVVMTILNMTPDSFFADSRKVGQTELQIEEAIGKACEQGAEIIDVGGYSSRPGADDVSPQQEWERVASGITAIRKVSSTIAISVDTFRSFVARNVLENFGPCIINDISGGDLDPEIMDVVACHGVPYVAMHMKGTPANMQQHTQYNDIVEDVVSFFDQKISQLRSKGIQNIIIDPGFGFAKTTRQNYELLAGMDRLLVFGLPVLAGLSRKSMIYNVLESTPAESLAGTIALNWEALNKGASILRVHDTKAAHEVIKLYNYYKSRP